MIYLDKICGDNSCFKTVPDYENPLVTLYDSDRSEYYEARLNMIGKPVIGISKEKRMWILRRWSNIDRSLEKVIDVVNTYAHSRDSVELDASVNSISPNFVDVCSSDYGTVLHIIEDIAVKNQGRFSDIKNDMFVLNVMDSSRGSKIAISVKILNRSKFNALIGKLALIGG